MTSQFGVLEGRIDYEDDSSTSGLRDDLGLEKATGIVANAIAPQVNTRILTVAYVPYLLTAVDFSWKQVSLYKEKNRNVSAVTLRRRFMFWLDFFELCLAWTLKQNDEGSFIGINSLGKFRDEKEFEEYLKGLPQASWNQRLAFKSKFLTSRLSHAFDRHKYMLSVLGLIYPADIRGLYMVNARGILDYSSLKSLVARGTEVFAPGDCLHLYREFFLKRRKKISMENVRFNKKFWDAILFDEQVLKQTLPVYVSAKGLSHDQILKNTSNLKTFAQRKKGKLVIVPNRAAYLKLIGILGSTRDRTDLEYFLNLNTILNYYFEGARQVLNAINKQLLSGGSVKITFVRDVISKYSIKQKVTDFNKPQTVKFFRNLAGRDDDMENVVGFLKDFFAKGNAAKPIQVVRILGQRVATVKGFGDQVYSVGNSKVTMKDEQYRERASTRNNINPYDSRLDVVEKVYRQCHSE